MYQALKTALVQVENLEDVQWYNNQYEGIIDIAPVVYVEFAAIEIDPVARMSGQTDLGIQLHVVTEIVSEREGHIPDSVVEEHQVLAEEIVETLEGLCLPFMNETTAPLELAGWNSENRYNGWLVTMINLTTKG